MIQPWFRDRPLKNRALCSSRGNEAPSCLENEMKSEPRHVGCHVAEVPLSPAVIWARSTGARKYRCMPGRAHHSVRAALRTDSSLRRAWSDAPYPVGLATGDSLWRKTALYYSQRVCNL